MTTLARDGLVREGLSFHNTFSVDATCVGSRAATFTSMYEHNTGAYSSDY